MKSHESMNPTRGAGISRLRRFIFLLAAPVLALSMAGCNGKVFASLGEGKGIMDYILYLGGPKIVSIEITPNVATVPSGVPVQFGIIATLSNETTRALTTKEMAQVVWDANNPTGLGDITIVPAPDMTYVTVTAKKETYNDGIDVVVAIQATLRLITGTANLTLNDADLVSIEITPGVATIKRLTTQKFTARGTYTDGSIHDISTVASWSSDNPGVASIASDGNGTATGQGAGTTNIHASYESIDETTPAEITVEVPTLVSVSVTPVNRSIPTGFTLQYRATAIYDDDTTQDVTDVSTWVSTAPGQATVSDAEGSKGLATAVSSGTTQIEATFDVITGGTDLTVTDAELLYLAVTAQDGRTSMAKGTKLQFTVTGVFNDNTTQDLTANPLLSWGSSDTNVADFEFHPSDPMGMITGKNGGSTNITAVYNPGVDDIESEPYELTVTEAELSSIIITPADPVAYVIAYGTNQQFTAMGVFSDSTTQDLTTQVDWTSSNTPIANIDLDTGLAITAAAGDTVIWARYPKGGGYEVSESTTLRVVFLTLLSIEVTPTPESTWVGQTVQYAAEGTYDGGYKQILTDQVLWESTDTGVAVISNSTGSKGLASALSAGTTNITATRGGITSDPVALLTVAASDTEPPKMKDTARILPGDRVEVTFIDGPMDIASAMNPAYYKVLPTSSLSGEECSDNGNFDDTDSGLLINSVDFVNQSVFILNLGEGTLNIQYTVVGDRNNLRDVAGNFLNCPNTSIFYGVDTVKPYIVQATNPEPTKVYVYYSEPMKTGGGLSAADNIGNYTIAENPSDGDPDNNVSITSITRINDATFILNLDRTTVSPPTVPNYLLTVLERVTDQAPVPNTMGSPRTVTFIGNEQLKVISAQALTLTTVKITFNKPVSTSTAQCSGAVDCHTKYKLFPRTTVDPYPARLGDITSAVRGSGNETNTVILTHATDQEGYAYTVAAANAQNGDGFDNDAVRIESATSTADYVQPAPKDRATFIGLGKVIEDFDDGEYFTDPFTDGSVFSWSFVYGGRVYLGTNDVNNAAFRFDPDGYNSVLVNFDFVDGIIATPACPEADGFGYGSGGTCGDNMGYNDERGVVGFTSATVTVSGDDYEILISGPIKDGVTHGYFTQDTDTTLDWVPVGFSVTGGNNTKSIQTPYAVDNHFYLGFSSNHGQQAPIVSRHAVTASDGVITVATGTDMSIRSVPFLGKQAGGDSNTADIVGIDSMIKYNEYLYMANNGGIRYSSNFTNFSGSVSSTPSTQSGTTLWLNSLEKVSPGYKGVPILREYNGRLYMARNVTSGAPDNYTRLRGELWKCEPGTTGGALTCDPGDWTRIITGEETDLTASAISLIQDNGSGRLYVGFDHSSGISVWRIESTNPPATSGTMTSAGWAQQGPAGLAGGHDTIYSSATISDGTYDYIYLTAGNGTEAIRVYRQREEVIP